MEYYLAIDVGASGGRMIVGALSHNRIQLHEIHRFSHQPVFRSGQLCWQIELIYQEILTGLRKCWAVGKIPASLGIDTWGVDFVLVGNEGQLIGDAVSYRDARTRGMDEQVGKLIGEEALYTRTGIQKLSFNSLYQLTALKLNSPALLEQARRFLMLPDYFTYLLTGEMINEYTNATTTGLVNAKTQAWDQDLLAVLGIPERLFSRLVMPGTGVGRLKDSLAAEVGFSCKVVLPASHDTASAVVAVPQDGGTLYISSGTWSLMGIESERPNCSKKSWQHNFTNEGGYGNRFCYLKNIMGLWMIQQIRQELGAGVSYQEISRLARLAEGFPALVDVNDPAFLAPQSMIETIQQYCRNTGQPVPSTPGELAECVYRSLAKSYADTVAEIQEITAKDYSSISDARIHVVGGGCQDLYLNELTAQAAGMQLFAGPVEATSTGNILVQMIQAGELSSLADVRRLVADSFDIQKFG